MKILLGNIKNSERQHLFARSFSFWREFPDVCLQARFTPAGHAVCGCPMPKRDLGTRSGCPSLSFYRCCQSFSICYLSHFFTFILEFSIIHSRIFDYSLFLKATTHYSFQFFHRYSLFRFHPRISRRGR